jgi:hypothetical protein
MTEERIPLDSGNSAGLLKTAVLAIPRGIKPLEPPGHLPYDQTSVDRLIGSDPSLSHAFAALKHTCISSHLRETKSNRIPCSCLNV